MAHAVYTNSMEARDMEAYFGSDAECPNCGSELLIFKNEECNYCVNPQCKFEDSSDYSSGKKDWTDFISDHEAQVFKCKCGNEYSGISKYDFKEHWENPECPKCQNPEGSDVWCANCGEHYFEPNPFASDCAHCGGSDQ